MSDEPDRAGKRDKPKTRRVGQVLERGENKWLIRIFRGYKPNGQNGYFNKTFHGAKKDAEKWLRGALARRDRGEPLEDPNISFETLFNEWVDSKKRKPRTQEIYRDNFKYYIKLVRNIVRLRGGKWEFGDMKIDDSARSFTLPASFMAMLKEHRTAQLEQRMRIGRDWYDYDLVFTNEVGEPLAPSSYQRLWKKILTAAGLSAERVKMRPYDARHTMATLLLSERTPTKVVSARLGHASTAITEDVYSHVLEAMQDQATGDLERAILKGKKA